MKTKATLQRWALTLYQGDFTLSNLLLKVPPPCSTGTAGPSFQDTSLEAKIIFKIYQIQRLPQWLNWLIHRLRLLASYAGANSYPSYYTSHLILCLRPGKAVLDSPKPWELYPCWRPGSWLQINSFLVTGVIWGANQTMKELFLSLLLLVTLFFQ